MNTHKLVTILLLCLLHAYALGQSSTQNYVQITTMTSSSGSGVAQVDYYDGLGRPVERVMKNAGPSSQDWIYLTDYDACDRLDKEWLPAVVSGNNGSYVAPSTVRTNSSTSNSGDSKPYALSVYEASSLKRATGQFGPGSTWHSNNKAVYTSYLSNSSSYVCSKYTSADSRQSISITRNGNYPVNELYVTKLQDEDDHLSYEFKDKLGQVVLTRQVNGSTNFDTYFVYDSYGNLRAVLPPLAADAFGSNATWTEAQGELQKYAYLYKYDNQNRCIAKKLPGADWVYYVYDQGNRLIFTQDGVLRSSGKWKFTIPDAFGRIVLTGTCTNSLSYASNPLGGVVKAIWGNATNANKGYTISGVSLSGMEVLSADYYDQYDFIGKNSVPASLNVGSRSGYPSSIMTPRGLLTGRINTQIGSSSTCYYEAYYYDARSRLVQTRSTNHLSGTDNEYVAYTFDGLPDKRYHEHTALGSSKTEEYVYTYDAGRRATKVTHSWNGGSAKVLSEKSYDGLGRLLTDKKGGQDNLKTTYSYDIRSRLTKQEEFHYYQALGYSYGSNIISQNWQANAIMQSYSYTYDGLSRLTNAAYTGTGRNYTTTYGYDKHGNPTSIQRNGMTSSSTYGLIDNLSFSYIGNQLSVVNDAVSNIPYSLSHDFKNYTSQSSEYTYDLNGNQTKDLNRGVSSVSYNILNLPNRIDIKSPVGEARNDYVYRSDGNKMRVVHKWNPNYSTAPVIGSGITETSLTKSETTDYVGNYVYVNNALKRTLTENGYIENGAYYFHLKDHLGNNHITTDAFANRQQTLNYYPYGMQYGDAIGSDVQPYKYGGKEYDAMHGLDVYDYEARYYDPALGRFMMIDPLAEKYYSWSPYGYCLNNPLKFVDPDGKKIVIGSFLGRLLASFGVNNYEKKVEDHLNVLKEINPEINNMIKYIEQSSETVEIINIPITQKNRGNKTIRYYKDATLKQGSIIQYDPDNYFTNSDVNRERKRNPIIGLSHELGHAESYLRGEGVNYNSNNALKRITPDVEAGNKNEKNAIEKENIVRKKFNIQIRDYDYYDKKNKIGDK